MIIFCGFICLIIGGCCYAYGDSINNDLEAQMESIFNDGVSNPGSIYENIGIILIIIGIALLIIGVVKNYSANKSQPNTAPIKYTNGFICPICKASLPPDSEFCTKCGYILDAHATISCPHCNATLSPKSKFCNICGKEIAQPSENTCLRCGNIIQKEDLFCPYCGYKSK